ncbi:hypothetical protein FE257_001032 [Aspergillus nanangensis]|uniref:Uncharacterized protein n=1 Tax=Aspergillus nanangensis TaxID=2582783 RepID=A0AAD4GXE4_ASPNN|nr:hypothetical protein FE257_001032 [Aspergillus nanangensis]
MDLTLIIVVYWLAVVNGIHCSPLVTRDYGQIVEDLNREKTALFGAIAKFEEYEGVTTTDIGASVTLTQAQSIQFLTAKIAETQDFVRLLEALRERKDLFLYAAARDEMVRNFKKVEGDLVGDLNAFAVKSPLSMARVFDRLIRTTDSIFNTLLLPVQLCKRWM